MNSYFVCRAGKRATSDLPAFSPEAIVGDDVVLAEHGADEQRRLLGLGRPARHLDLGRSREPVAL